VLHNFGSILSVLFVIWQWILQDFVIIWQNTWCTLCHPAMACLPNWCFWKVLPDVEIQHNFLIIHACVHGHRKDFIQGGTSGFCRMFFSGRPKVVKFVFCHSKLRKQLFLLKIPNSYLPPAPMLVCSKTFVPHH